ncbi:MAG TPA: DUF6093 family protein [Nocardioidaceae bacterium]|nr:DUF6093 family protein [Nocardioidaceae bacterium]
MTTFGAEVANALAELRALAESRMRDTCKITKPGEGQGPWNPATGTYDDPAPVTVYEGKCKIKAPALVNPFQASAGPETWQVEQSVLSVPADAPSIEAGMTVTYLTAANNPNLPGRIFGVVGPHHESTATAQRLLVKEVVGTGGG